MALAARITAVTAVPAASIYGRVPCERLPASPPVVVLVCSVASNRCPGDTFTGELGGKCVGWRDGERCRGEEPVLISSDTSESEPESEFGSTSEMSSSLPLLCREGTARDARVGRPRSGCGMSGDSKLSLTCVVAGFSRTNMFASQKVTGCSVTLANGPAEFRVALRRSTLRSVCQLFVDPWIKKIRGRTTILRTTH